MQGWAPVPGFPKYSVSNLGQVQHNRTGRLIRPQVNQRGAVYVVLMHIGQHFSRSLPLLVANVFMPERTEAFDTVINLDGNRFNCAVDNLMWRPRWFAIQYNRQFSDPYERSIKAPIRALSTGEVLPGSLEVATRYGLLERDVVQSIEHRTFTWPTFQQFDLAE